MAIITLTTDFGPSSPYVAAMKGVILSINPAAMLVDLTHGIRPQDVRQGALALDDVTDRFPADTIHVAVVDPGVGTERGIVYARIGRQQYVAPDNGLLSLLARRTARPARLQRPPGNCPRRRQRLASPRLRGRRGRDRAVGRRRVEENPTGVIREAPPQPP